MQLTNVVTDIYLQFAATFISVIKFKCDYSGNFSLIAISLSLFCLFYSPEHFRTFPFLPSYSVQSHPVYKTFVHLPETCNLPNRPKSPSSMARQTWRRRSSEPQNAYPFPSHNLKVGPSKMAGSQGEIRVGPASQVKDIYVRTQCRDGKPKFFI